MSVNLSESDLLYGDLNLSIPVLEASIFTSSQSISQMNEGADSTPITDNELNPELLKEVSKEGMALCLAALQEEFAQLNSAYDECKQKMATLIERKNKQSVTSSEIVHLKSVIYKEKEEIRAAQRDLLKEEAELKQLTTIIEETSKAFTLSANRLNEAVGHCSEDLVKELANQKNYIQRFTEFAATQDKVTQTIMELNKRILILQQSSEVNQIVLRDKEIKENFIEEISSLENSARELEQLIKVNKQEETILKTHNFAFRLKNTTDEHDHFVMAPNPTSHLNHPTEGIRKRKQMDSSEEKLSMSSSPSEGRFVESSHFSSSSSALVEKSKLRRIPKKNVEAPLDDDLGTSDNKPSATEKKVSEVLRNAIQLGDWGDYVGGLDNQGRFHGRGCLTVRYIDRKGEYKKMFEGNYNLGFLSQGKVIKGDFKLGEGNSYIYEGGLLQTKKNGRIDYEFNGEGRLERYLNRELNYIFVGQFHDKVFNGVAEKVIGPNNLKGIRHVGNYTLHEHIVGSCFGEGVSKQFIMNSEGEEITVMELKGTFGKDGLLEYGTITKPEGVSTIKKYTTVSFRSREENKDERRL